MKKRILSTITIFALILGMVACGKTQAIGKESVKAGKTVASTAQAKPGKEELSDEDAFVAEWMASHSLEEKVEQMFILRPENVHSPVGGIIYFAQDLQTPDQTKAMIEDVNQYYENENVLPPFIAVDEEGGRVARVGNNPAFGVAQIPDMAAIGATGDTDNAAQVGVTISRYLLDLGFNMDMAPVADVLSNPNNEVIGKRSFGSDPQLVSDMVVAEYNAMMTEGMLPVIKHFPGHGGTEADSHEGYAYTNKTLDELMACELVPFANAIDDGVEVIMVSHVSVPNVTGNNEPSSISKYMITDVLRDQMGYDGVVITDSMGMGAISQNYTSEEASVKAVQAGVDIILMPKDYDAAYQGILNAVSTGQISEDRINDSVERILRLKYKYIIK